MKKSILLAALTFFALAGCTKPDQTTPNEASQDGPRVTLNLTVAPKDAFGTKAIKAAWEDNDYLYLFFAPEGISSYKDLKNVIVKYNTGNWEVEADCLTALSAINASGKVLAIYTSGPKRPIEEDAVNGLFHLGEASAALADPLDPTNAYGLTMSQATDYTFAADKVTVNLTLTRHATAQITVTGITNDTNNQWVLFNCGTGAATFSGISRLAAVFESGSFNETALCETTIEEVIGVNNGSDVTFYVSGIDDSSKSVRLLLYNTKTEQNYVRILDATNKAEAGNAYTITAPDPEDDTHTPDTNGWYHGFLTEYTADSEPEFSVILVESPKELVAHGHDAVAKRGYVIFKSGCPEGAFLKEEEEGYPITTVAIQNGVTSIEDLAFAFCTSLTTVSLPCTLTKIYGAAFAFCKGLTGITLPEGLTYLDDEVFGMCTGLISIIIPEGVSSIGGSTFYKCEKLESITLPEELTHICYEAFKDCTSLESITLPEKVERVDKNAFMGCTNLTTVTCLATTPAQLGDDVFADTHSSLIIYVPSTSLEAYKTAWPGLTIQAMP